MCHMKWLTGRTTEGPAAANDSPALDAVRMTAWVHGFVQGVGFRWWTRSRALELGLVGSASNLADGRVEVVAQGARGAVEQLLALIRSGTGPGRIDGIVERWS